MANSFFLFKVPRVKEILGKPLQGFEHKQDINLDSIPYKDDNKGKQKEDLISKRKEKLQRKIEAKQEERETKKKEKPEKITRTVKKQRKRENDWDEWEQLQREENLAKKLKRGKITQEEFDDLVGDDLSD